MDNFKRRNICFIKNLHISFFLLLQTTMAKNVQFSFDFCEMANQEIINGSSHISNCEQLLQD